MNAIQWRLVGLVVVGGTAVLGSYVHGLGSNPETRGGLWGGVPGAWQAFYTANMFLAAAGWFAFTSYVLFRVPTGEPRVAGRFGFGLFTGLQAVILVGSALWLPLTFRMLDSPSAGLWALIRLDLLAVGVASLAIIAALLVLSPRESPGWHRLAVIGAVFFSLQTFVLDALVWPAYFPT